MLNRKEENTMKRNLALAITTVAILGAGVFASTKVSAATTSVTDSPMSTLVQKIADKFGLNKADVQAVFDQERADRQAEMQAKFEAQLTQDVTDGKITDAQKQLVLAKRKELESARQAEMQSLEGKTAEERQAAMAAKKTARDAERTALQNWATQNNIDVKYVFGGFGKGHRGGFGSFDRDGQDADDASQPTSTTVPAAQ